MYENWKILKSELDEKAEEYSQVAEWCNEGQKYHIEDTGEYYEVVKNSEPTEDELKSQVRNIRNMYLQQCDFTQLPDAPFTEEEKQKYVEYREYLREYTDQENWWLKNPLTFEEWKESNN